MRVLVGVQAVAAGEVAVLGLESAFLALAMPAPSSEEAARS
jgi:hypothetical protein